MNTEHLVLLVNAVGAQAKVCVIRMQGGDKHAAIKLALRQGHRDFNVVERADSPEGYSDQRVATVRNGSAA